MKHKVNDEFEYKQFVTVLTYCFVFRQGLSIPLRFCQNRNNILKKMQCTIYSNILSVHMCQEY